MQNSSRIVIIAAVAILCAPVSAAEAGQLDLIVNGKSYHINSEYDWNEDNFGLGLEYQFNAGPRWIWTAIGNGFVDSQNNMSYMAGAGLKRRLFMSERAAGFYLDAGLVAFFMARADINDYEPFPGVLPVLSVDIRRVGLNLTYLPQKAVREFAGAKMLDPGIGGVFFLQFKFRLRANL